MKLAILLHALESEKPLLSPIMDKLQFQINNIGGGVEVVYRINEEESVDEKKAWLLSQTEAKRYVFIDATTDIPDNFLLLRYNSVKLRKPTRELLKLDIYSK